MVNLEIATLVLAHLGSEKSHLDAFRFRVVARIDVGVAAGDLSDHPTDNIVEIQTGLDVRQKGSVLFFYRLPVASVHILKIVAVAERSPNLVKDLRPLLGVVNGRVHVVEVDGLASTDFR